MSRRPGVVFARRGFLLLMLLLLAACAGGRGNGDVEPGPRRTTVLVQNRTFVQVNVFVVRGAERVRLGTVPAVDERALPIPADVVGHGRSLRFLFDAVGSSSEPTSFERSVFPGAQVLLELRRI